MAPRNAQRDACKLVCMKKATGTAWSATEIPPAKHPDGRSAFFMHCINLESGKTLVVLDECMIVFDGAFKPIQNFYPSELHTLLISYLRCFTVALKGFLIGVASNVPQPGQRKHDYSAVGPATASRSWLFRGLLTSDGSPTPL